MALSPKHLRHALSSIRSTAAKEKFGWRAIFSLIVDKYLASRHHTSPIGSPEFPLTDEVLYSIKTVGFHSIPNFISVEECNLLSSALQGVFKVNPSMIHPSTPYDLRIHGVENLDYRFRFFSDHPMLREIACRYLKEPAKAAFTLGASLVPSRGNPGSGGGWHRDSFTRQFKTMLYLTDVNENNGPFQILSGSHHTVRTIRDNLIIGRPYGDSRLSEADVEILLSKTSKNRLVTLTAKAGTLLIFDSTTIHRGAPIIEGNRLALTNYFYPERDITPELFKHFHPVARANS